jgi:MFS superfamily sulfate permease-like transporter
MSQNDFKTRLLTFFQDQIPIFRWIRSYDYKRSLVGDVIAGLTVTAVAAPEAVSYAAIAGLPAAQGLYTGFLGPLAYAITGSSPQLIVGPTAIMCILTDNAIPTTWAGAAVTPMGSKSIPELRVELAALLALFVAALQLSFAIFRLGGLVALISTPVVVGFTSGSALLTASSQFSTLLGMPKCVGASGGSCTFYEAVHYIVASSSLIQGNVCLMSLICLSILFAFKFGPELLKLPKIFKIVSNLAPLILVLITVPIVANNTQELEKWGLTAPAAIPSGLPSPFLPFGSGSLTRSGTQSDYISLIVAALPLAIIGYMGAVTICKTAARQNGPYSIDPSQELWAQVAANAACGIGRGLPVTGSFSRTAVNASSGATTGLASLLTSLLMAASLELLTGTLSLVPSVARAAIVVVAIAKMIELQMFPSLWRSDKRDFWVFTITFLVTIFVDASTGLIAGVASQWLAGLTRLSASPSDVRLFAWAVKANGTTVENDWVQLQQSISTTNSEAPPMPEGGCVALEFLPDLQFSNAERARVHIDECVAAYAPSVLIFDARRVASADTSGTSSLLGAASDALELSNCLVIICNLSLRDTDVLYESAVTSGDIKQVRNGATVALQCAQNVGIEAISIGAVIVVRSTQAAMTLAKEISSSRALSSVIDHHQLSEGEGFGKKVLMKSSLSVSSLEMESPLLNDKNLSASDGSVMTTNMKQKPKVLGVPLSPSVELRQQIRRQRLPFARQVNNGGIIVENNDDNDNNSSRLDLDGRSWRRQKIRIDKNLQDDEEEKEDNKQIWGQETFNSLQGAFRDFWSIFDESKPALKIV